VTHFSWLRRRLRRSARARLGALILAFIVLPAIFAETVAADVPLFTMGPDGVTVLAAVITPPRHAGKSRMEIIDLHRDDFVIWPLIRCGPATTCDVGPDAPVSLSHPLGTDHRGRDSLARVIYGARTALGLALVALALALLLGILLGGLAGYVGGFWDEVLSRPVEFVEAFPAIIVVAVVRAVFDDESLWSLALAVAAVRWAEIARLFRAEVIRATNADHVMAARALGCSHLRILRRHIAPQALRPVAVSLMFGVASVVLLEVAVSFLGLGSGGSWGAMIADGLHAEAAAGGAMWAGAALAATVLASYLMADAFNEAVDARSATTSRGL
jgi:peptide/nickel transport system permease protein